MGNSYYKSHCPKCSTKNWFTLSEFDGDCSKEDDSLVFECFKCHHKYIEENDFLSKEDLCEAMDFILWDYVGRDINRFIAEAETSLGRETPE